MKTFQRNQIGVLVVAVFIGLWTSPSPAQQLTLKGHNEEIISVVFSPDGKTLASGSYGKTLASGSWGAEIILWDTKTWKEKKTLKGHSSLVYSIAFSPDGKLLTSAGLGEGIKVWDANSWKEQRTLKISNYRHYGSSGVSFSPDGKTLAVPNSPSQTDTRIGEIKLLDTQSWKEKLILKDTTSVNTVSFSPDGKILAAAGPDSHIILYSTKSGRIERTLKEHEGGVGAVTFSPDGKFLATSGLHKPTIKVWDVDTGKEKQILKLQSNLSSPVLFSPDGKTLVSTEGDGKIRIWDTTTWKEKQKFQHNNHVSCIAFSPDGKILASAGSTIVENGKEVPTISNHTIKLWNMDEK